MNIRSVEDLERAARSGNIRELQGFGRKTEEMILHHAERYQSSSPRMCLADAKEFVESLLEYLRGIPGIKDVSVAGSYRRWQETVGDIDILVTAAKGTEVIERFVNYDEVVEIVSHGTTRSTVILRSGLQVDLRVVPQVSYGAALCYFTGSKAHNIKVDRPQLIQNPLELRIALLFGALLALIMVLGEWLRQWMGETGIYLLAATSGFADVDAITLTLTRMAPERIDAPTAVLGIVIAAVVNNLLKAGLAAFIGTRHLGVRVALPMVFTLVVGLILAWLV